MILIANVCVLQQGVSGVQVSGGQSVPEVLQQLSEDEVQLPAHLDLKPYSPDDNNTPITPEVQEALQEALQAEIAFAMGNFGWEIGFIFVILPNR